MSAKCQKRLRQHLRVSLDTDRLKETYHLEEPTNRSQPIVTTVSIYSPLMLVDFEKTPID